MTPVHGKGPRARLARRGFLGALAVAPAVLACATTAPSPKPAASPPTSGPGVPASRETPAFDAVRSFALADDAGPAIVFRAAPARPGGPR